MNNQPPYPYQPYDVVRASQQDKEHLTALAICYYVMAGLTFLSTCGMALYMWMLLMMSKVFDPTAGAPPMGVPHTAGTTVLLTVLVILLCGTAFAGLFAYAGRCLQLRKNSVLIMIAAAINCLHFPLGTVLGVLTFVVLGRPSVKATFDQHTSSYTPTGGAGGAY
jgi:hypothetical protein